MTHHRQLKKYFMLLRYIVKLTHALRMPTLAHNDILLSSLLLN